MCIRGLEGTPRNNQEALHLWSTGFWQKCQGHWKGGDHPFSEWYWGNHVQENEATPCRLVPHAKISFTWIKEQNYSPQGKARGTSLGPGIRKRFLSKIPKAQAAKGENRHTGLPQN